jgi:hypothetical protein
MDLPNCLDCKYSDQGFPCHKPDGSYDFAKVGRAVVLYGRTFADGEDETFDATARDEHAWSGDCSFEVEQDYPHLLLPLTIAAMDACETPRDAAYLAAGLLENAVGKHGPRLIGDIEKLAFASPKFRYFLSAIWGESRADPGVWTRVRKAVGTDGVMDTDHRSPVDSATAIPLSADAAVLLLQERVTATALRLGIF